MMNLDPWAKLDPASVGGTVTARRVDAAIPWDFFWARDTYSRCLLVLKHAGASTSASPLPRLRGIDVELTREASGNCSLTFKLLEPAHQDIFLRLCQDIVSSASAAKSEKAAVDAALQRTWRWHHLLRGGMDDRLAEEEQMGLIGELAVLERYLLTLLPPRDAVRSWLGPTQAPKDFEIGQVCVEVKTHRSGASPSVVINSEFQLDDTGLKGLVLSVMTLDRAAPGSSGRVTLTDVALRVRGRIAEMNSSVVADYESLLEAAGFRWTDDYTDVVWTEGAITLFRVAGQFPRVVAGGLAPGVRRVTYTISLTDCQEFRIRESDLVALLQGP